LAMAVLNCEREREETYQIVRPRTPKDWTSTCGRSTMRTEVELGLAAGGMDVRRAG
jgi:hypothetical protein